MLFIFYFSEIENKGKTIPCYVENLCLYIISTDVLLCFKPSTGPPNACYDRTQGLSGCQGLHKSTLGTALGVGCHLPP